jgi:GGDEF domain-containing protein
MPNGTVIEIRSGRLPDGSLVQTFTDVTKRHEAETHAARLASEDPLTGLPNRHVFRSAIDLLSRERDPITQRPPANSDFALLFLDLDRFKVVNDALGHRVGDLLLQEVASRLKQALPTTALLARLGGDEFVIVAPSFGPVRRSRIWRTPAPEQSVNLTTSTATKFAPASASASW